MLDAVRAIVSDPELINATRLRIAAADSLKEAARLEDDAGATADATASSASPVSPSPATTLDTALEQWEALRSKYPCVICQDVLSAPCVLNCSHSFCGRCINDLMYACVPVDTTDSSSNPTVVYECPCCKVEIVNTTFERMLDEDIASLVERIGDCPAKEAWTERREFSTKKMKKANTLRNQQQREGGGDDEDEEDVSWSELLTEWAPPLTFLVLVLIVVVRGSGSR